MGINSKVSYKKAYEIRIFYIRKIIGDYDANK